MYMLHPYVLGQITSKIIIKTLGLIVIWVSATMSNHIAHR